MQNKLVVVEIKNGRIEIELEDFWCLESPLKDVSFYTCFDISFSGSLPKIFKRRSNKIFCKKKIERPKAIAQKIECSPGITLEDLKKVMPSIFDIDYINNFNTNIFAEENFEVIVEIASTILDRNEVMEILGPVGNHAR